MPGSKGNQNAAGHGLYSANPPARIPDLALVPESLSLERVGELARDMADAALAISQELAEAQGEGSRGTMLIVLYAEVANELHQFAAEAQGVTGIKPATLGRLSVDQFERLMRNQARELHLVLAQCKSAYQAIEARREVARSGVFIGGEVRKEGDQIVEVVGGEINPVLHYLAGHMRAAKRLLKQFAANKAWQMANVGEGDLVARVWSGIQISEQKEDGDE